MTLRARLRPAVPGLVGLLLAGTLVAGALPAAAQPAAPPAPVDAEHAKAIETDLRAWLSAQIGAIADVAALPLRVVAGDTGYRLEVPLGAALADGAVTLGEGAITARLRQIDEHRWAIDDMRLPSPWSVRVDPSVEPAGKAAVKGMTVKIDEQDIHGILDPTLATTSSFDVRMAGYSVLVDGAQGPQATRIGSLTGHAALQPTSDGLLTVTSLSSAENYGMQSMMPDGGAVAVSIAHARTSVTATGVDMTALGELVRSVSEIAASVRDEASKNTGMAARPPGVPEADRAKARAVVRALAGLLGAVTSETTYEDIKVGVGDKGGSLHKFSIGFDMSAPKGRADLAWRIGLDGLASPMIPPGAIREMLPHHLSLTPRISGIAKDDLVQIALRAIDDPDAADSFMATMMELLSKGPLQLGVDDIAFDLGPAKISGGGAVAVAAMDDITGNADFRMTGLDALIRRANTTPELKQAAPGLIFLKGIGRQEGTATVWHIRYGDGKVMVNDTDLSGMMPGK